MPPLPYGVGDDPVRAVSGAKVDQIDALVESILNQPDDAFGREAFRETKPAWTAGTEPYDAHVQAGPPKRCELHLFVCGRRMLREGSKAP